MFDSIFQNGTMTPVGFLVMVTVSVIFGSVFAVLSAIRSRSSKSFGIATALLPMAVAVVIALVNGNLGVGVAVAGAFGLVRFRSAPGTAREIAVIFIAMAGGLAFGTGYLFYGALFLLLSGILLCVFDIFISFANENCKTRYLKITIPESIDYTTVFDEEMDLFTKKRELLKVKSVNMGSMFRLSYRVILKDVQREKTFLDALRIKNGNLEILIQNADFSECEL